MVEKRRAAAADTTDSNYEGFSGKDRHVSPELAALVTVDGSGFQIERDKDRSRRRFCKYCGADLYTEILYDERLCEIDSVIECFDSSKVVIAAPARGDCFCSWCELARFNPGRPRVACNSPSCKRKLAADRKRAERARNRQCDTHHKHSKMSR